MKKWHINGGQEDKDAQIGFTGARWFLLYGATLAIADFMKCGRGW